MSGRPSLRPLQTLKGIFDLPQAKHRRDFLRENKLVVRELESISQRKQKLEEKREQERLALISPLQLVIKSAKKEKHGDEADAASSSQSRSKRRVSSKTTEWCPSCHRPQDFSGKQSKTSLASSVHKKTQTDDICDETYLMDALTKCSVSDAVAKADVESQTKADAELDTDAEPDYDVNYESEEVANLLDSDDYNTAAEPEPVQDNVSMQTMVNWQQAAKTSGTDGYDNQSVRSQANTACSNHSYGKGNSAMPDTFSTRSQATVASKRSKTVSMKNEGIADDCQSVRSALSRASIVSDMSRCQSMRSEKGQLPRYLAKEKVEKEEQRMREIELQMQQDPKCPAGYQLVNEDERQQSLNEAQANFEALINELNHLPITSETMRIKLRRAEIEKELIAMEQRIQQYSKSKVYVKGHRD